MGEETEKPTNKIGVVATVLKKPRHRKKLLYQELKKQMEFYFGDVNISKDRFMNERLQESPYVPISVFLGFNRIKAMTSKEKDIARALQSSDLLKVTDCGTKVYRISSPQQKENADECTIYVEQIPLDADHTWLIDIFHVYGPVDYVSIPKFKHSRKNKGFAFVEFKDPQSAKNALAAFADMGCSLSNQMEPSNLFSIRTFEENENEIADKNQIQQISEDNSVHDFSNKIHVDHTVRKPNNEHELLTNDSDEIKTEINERKRKISYDDENYEDHCKKRITDDGDNNISEINHCKSSEKNENENECLKRKRKFSESGEVSKTSVKFEGDVGEGETGRQDEGSVDNVRTEEDHAETMSNEQDANKKEADMSEQQLFDENVGDEIDEDNIDYKRKKNRKRKKKHRRSKSHDAAYGLQILSKTEWKSLRNKYLNEQRKKMKQLKQYLWNRKTHDYNSGKYGNNRMEITEPRLNSCSSKCDNIKKETSSYISNDIKATDGEFEISNRLKLCHGQIVKINLPEPVINKSSFKNETKIFPEIKYVDIKEGSDTVYLRFSTATSAEQCVKSGHWPSATVIEGEEEKAYWDMIAQEREEKLNSNRFARKGRDKLLKKAEKMHKKHIWFD